MPAAPEFLDGKGEVRAFKVGHQVDPEEFGTAHGNIGISGEVTVDFYGKHDCDNDKDQTYIGIGVVIYFVDNTGENIGNYQFLEITPHHQFDAISHVLVYEGTFFFILGQQAVGPADGTGQKLWKK